MKKEVSLAAVLLAAGPSSRLGQAKQLVEFEGESLVRRSARRLLGLKLQSLTVVSGREAERVASEVRDLPLSTVFNPRWQQGMGASINCGVRSLSWEADGLLLAVCDQWRLETADLQRLAEAWLSDISRICLANWKEGNAFISGPPAIFPRKLIPELKGLHEHRGARQLIDRHMDIVEFVNTPNAAFDLDRPSDLESMTWD